MSERIEKDRKIRGCTCAWAHAAPCPVHERAPLHDVRIRRRNHDYRAVCSCGWKSPVCFGFRIEHRPRAQVKAEKQAAGHRRSLLRVVEGTSDE